MEVSNEILNDLAQNLISGLKTYLHKETLEVMAIPDPDQMDDLKVYWKEDLKKIRQNKKKLIEIEPMPSYKGFKMMEDFVESIDDKMVRGRLLQAIGGRKPFANFKIEIDHSGEYRELWFTYKNEQTLNWIRDQLELL